MTSPSAYVADLLLFLIALFTPDVLAVLVPQTYLTHAPTARLAALHRYEAAGKLATVLCPTSERELVGGVWVLIFGNAAEKEARVSGTVGDLHAWTIPLAAPAKAAPNKKGT